MMKKNLSTSLKKLTFSVGILLLAAPAVHAAEPPAPPQVDAKAFIAQKGLQVEVSEGRWIDARPREDTFVVNIGELLELATNGYLRATVHRVETPPAGRDRLSIAFFLGARLDAVVPLYQLPPPLAAQARGPASDPLNPLLRDVGYNYLKGRIRSHPDVAQRFYRDVIGV